MRLSGIPRFRIASGTGLARPQRVVMVVLFESTQGICPRRLGNWAP